MITIDEAISKLAEARGQARLGGGTVLVLSLSGSGLETVAINDLVVGNDDDGAVVEVRVSHPALGQHEVEGQ